MRLCDVKRCPALSKEEAEEVVYGAITALNRFQTYVLHNNVFSRKMTFLPRDCITSLMFATRDLPTCNMLIRKHAYIHFMKSAAESRNVILHSIVLSDSLFTSPLWQHWRNICHVHPPVR